MALKFSSPTGYLANGSVSAVDMAVTNGVTLFSWMNMQIVQGTVGIGFFNNTDSDGLYTEFSDPGVFNRFRASFISGGSFTGTDFSSTGASTNTWYALGGVYSYSGGNMQADCWVNGVKSAGSPTALGAPSGLISTDILNFGSSPSGFSPCTAGLMAVWNVALTDLEMQGLANGASPLDIRSGMLAGMWDPSDMPVVPDLSGNGVNLTLFGTPTTVIGPPIQPIIRLRPKALPATASTATDFGVSGGSSVVQGGTTNNIIVTPNGNVATANCTITPTGPAGWTFTPSTRTITVGSGGAVAFTATAPGGATIGANSITFTASGGSSIANGTNHSINVTVLTSAASFTTTSPAGSIGTGATKLITYTLNNPAPHSGVVITPTLAGTPGGSVSPPTVVFAELDTVGTTTYTAGGSPGTETIGGTSVPTLTQTSTTTVTVTTSPLAAGVLSIGAPGVSSFTLTSTAPTGGVPPYKGQLYRSMINMGSSSLNVSDIGAAALIPVAVNPAIWGSSQTLIDNAILPSRTYYYQAVYTDSAGTEVVSNQVNGSANILAIGFIGDSITAGDHTTAAPGVIGNATGATLSGCVGQCVRFLKDQVSSNGVAAYNAGVPGASTIDWVLGQGNDYYPGAALSFTGIGCTVFVITLGTNDATTNNGGPTSPATVAANLAALIGQLKGDYPGCRIIVNCPPWLDGVRGNSSGLSGYSAATINKLRGYIPAYLSLVDNQSVFAGDFYSMSLINSGNQGSTGANGLMFDGVHPNDAGAALVGAMWGYAAARIWFPQLAFGGNA